MGPMPTPTPTPTPTHAHTHTETMMLPTARQTTSQQRQSYENNYLRISKGHPLSENVNILMAP